jgi:hypothetical protein
MGFMMLHVLLAIDHKVWGLDGQATEIGWEHSQNNDWLRMWVALYRFAKTV